MIKEGKILDRKCQKTIFEHFQKLRFRKAQLTMFMIAGIIILMTTSLVLMFRTETAKLWVEKLTMPEEIIPIREYVTSCLETTSRDGINLIAAKGGFTDIPDVIAKNPRAKLDIFPAAGMMIPLWYYAGKEYKPTLAEMQNRLAKYVEDNIGECINNFEGFQMKFDIEELSKPEIRRAAAGSRVEDFAAEYVNTYMIYRLKVTGKADNKVTKLSLFSAKVPVRLRKAFELAEKIYTEENIRLFLEKQLIALMNLNEDVIPVTHAGLSCSPRVELVSELKKRVQNIAQYNIPNTVINNTNTKELRDEDWYAKLHQTYDLGVDKTDMAVEFRYDSKWPMDFYVSPNSGRVIRADPIRIPVVPGIDIPTCFLQYHFTYDIQFPVMISIIDDETKNHESFVFNFAMPVMINHNEGDKVSNPVHVVFDQFVIPSEDYCTNYPKVKMDIKATNKVSLDDISDVKLSYRCSAAECDIGNITKIQGTRLDVPRCSNAQITAKKEGYLDAQQYADASKDGAVEIEMTPAEKINFKVIKKRLNNPRVDYTVQEGEAAIVTMTNEENQHTSIGIYDPLEPSMATIELLSQMNYVYDVDVMLVSNDSITGGYKANWTTDPTGLMTKNELVIYVFENPDINSMAADARDEAQYELLTNMVEISKQIPQPEFK